MNCADVSPTEQADISERAAREVIVRFIARREADSTPFFCYRLPNQTAVYYGVSSTVAPGLHPSAFIVAPFENPAENIESIIPESENQIVDAPHAVPLTDFPAAATTRDEHRNGVSRIRARLRALGSGKCVLSRVITGVRTKTLAESFLDISDSRPDAYIFLFRTPKAGMWLGASPELLLEGAAGKLKTMALAGTRPAGTEGDWDAKNIEEQALVTQHIVSVMERCGLSPEVSPRRTQSAGPVEHLCNTISAAFSSDKDTSYNSEAERLTHFLSLHSPTPALAGTPRDEAIRLIHSYEAHQRGHYGGFAGPYDSPRDFNFFVNLRSVRIEGERYAQFVGGGITRFSDEDAEWLETERKASTLPAL